nr:molecular chaperone TorD family protein [Eggerthella sinensis]
MNGAAPPARPTPPARLPAPALLRSLRVEATRLFVGAPEPAVSPYEGVARALAEGARPLLFVSPRSMDVERFVRSCGLGRPEGANEPLDHVAAECELLSYLASLAAGAPAPAGAPCGAALPGGSPQAAYAAFLDSHARRWMPSFAAAVRAEARAPFYGAAARLLAAVVERG